MDRGLSESSTRTNDVVLSVDRKIKTIYYKIVAQEACRDGRDGLVILLVDRYKIQVDDRYLH